MRPQFTRTGPVARKEPHAALRHRSVTARRLRPNELPAITVYGACLPEAGRRPVLVWEHGAAMPTE